MLQCQKVWAKQCKGFLLKYCLNLLATNLAILSALTSGQNIEVKGGHSRNDVANDIFSTRHSRSGPCHSTTLVNICFRFYHVTPLGQNIEIGSKFGGVDFGC